MSAPTTCCTPCESIEAVQIPGIEGDPGAAGADGANAFSLTNGVAGPFDAGDSVTVTMADTSMFYVGEYVSIEDVNGTDPGFFQITAIGANSLTMDYLDIGANGDGVSIANGKVVSPSGPPIATPVAVPDGGTGLTTLTDRAVIIGRAAADVEFAVPGANLAPLLSTGAASNPAFGALVLSGTGTVSGQLPVANGGTAVASLTDRSVIIGRAAAAVEFAVPGADTQPLLSTGAATNPAFGALNLAGTNTVTGSLPVANGGTAGTTKTTSQSGLGLGQASVSEYSSGAAYNLTNAAAVLVFGGSGNMEAVINAAGLWNLYYFVRTDYVGATFAAEQTVSLKLRRSNNTPGDVANSAHAWKTAIVTTLDHTAMLASYGPIAYSTVNNTDNIQVMASIDVSPSVGTIEAVEAYLVAVPVALT